MGALNRTLPGLVAVLVLAAAAAAGAAEPATPAAGAPVAVDDWDWGGFTGLDDAPVISTPTQSGWWTGKTFKSAEEVENARPDLDAAPRPAFAVFEDLPPFEVVPSERDADMHPCSNCHQWVQSDPTPRTLKKPHDNFALQHGLHGKGKFWCFTCHHLDGKGGLRTLEGEKLDFADAYVLCSQCHSGQARDWAFGAHGKRVNTWQGKRKVYNCTACHYQHRPALKARAPEAGPRIRMGLQRPAHWVAKGQRVGSDHGQRAPAGWKMRAGEQDEAAVRDASGKERTSAGERTSDGKS